MMDALPGIAGQIEEASGRELTERLLKRRGGTEISIPKFARGSMLSEIVGLQATEKMIREIGPGRLKLPCSTMRGAKARKAEAIRMLREGASVNQVALACDLHSRTVQSYRAGMDGGDDRQMDLPFGDENEPRQ